MTPPGPRRLKKIAVTIVVFGLCVNVMVFLASTYGRQRRTEKAVCECRTIQETENRVSDSEIHEESAQIEKESAANMVDKHIERRGDNIKVNRTNYATSKATLSRKINLRRHIISRAIAEVRALKSDAFIVKANKAFPNVGVSKIKLTRSTVEMRPVNLKNTQIITSSIIGKVPQIFETPLPATSGKSPKPTPRQVPLSTLKHKKILTEKISPSSLVQVPLTSPSDLPKVPSTPAITRAHQSFSAVNTVKRPTAKTPPSSRNVSDGRQVNDVVSKSNKTNLQSVTEQLSNPTQIIPATSDKPPVTSNNQSKKAPAGTSDFAWKTLTDTLSIFSSYQDSRYLKTKPYGIYRNSLVIFGYEKSKLEVDLFCVIITDDNKRVLVEKPAVRIVLAEYWLKSWQKYRAMMYRCNLTIPGNLRYASLYDATVYKDFNVIPQALFVPVVNNHFPVEHKFGVCYETPLYGNKYDQEIMDSIEMNRILGATWFTLYVFEAHDKALEILKYYSEELKILDAVLNWGRNIPSPVYNRGLLAGVHDCVYRNMFRVHYLVLCDLDEVITPQPGIDWHNMMVKLDRPERAYFLFRHLGFHKNHSKPIEFLPCPGRTNLTYKMPSFFAVHNRSVNVITKNRQVKSIAKPRYSIAVHVHYSRWMLPGYVQFFVPTDFAVLKHYREKDDPRYLNYNSTLDYSMDRFKPVLLAEIEKHYCKNIKRIPA